MSTNLTRLEQAGPRPTTGEREGIPLSLVNLSRWVYATGPVIGLLLSMPLITTVLWILDLVPLVFGRKWSLIGAVGRMLFAKQLVAASVEDKRIITFNRSLVVVLLSGAQVAFLAGVPVVGWVLALMVAAANGVALAGFCVGCFLFYQFKLSRYRLFGGS